MGALYDDEEDGLRLVKERIRKDPIFHTLAQGTPFKVTWTGAGCRCDLSSGGSERISGDRLRSLLAEFKKEERLTFGKMNAPERYAIAILAGSQVHTDLPSPPTSARSPKATVNPSWGRPAPLVDKNQPADVRPALCKHGKVPIRCNWCKGANPIDPRMVLDHMLSLVSTRKTWTAGDGSEFQATLDEDGLEIQTADGWEFRYSRTELLSMVGSLLAEYNGTSHEPPSDADDHFVLPIFEAAVAPHAPALEVSDEHKLKPYVRLGWPRIRLLWLAAAMDWGEQPTSLQGLKGQDWKDAHDRLYPGGSVEAEEWWVLADGVCKRDGYICNACGTTDRYLEVDHIQSLSRGGTNDAVNLWSLCRACHITKTWMSRRVNWLDVTKAAKFREAGNEESSSKEGVE